MATSVLFTAGCGMGGLAPAGQGLSSSGATVEGTVYGGHQPIGGATVNLYSVGTTGYGLGATLLAQTKTSTLGDGGFTFTQVAVQPGTLNSNYHCPSSTTEIYITVTSGDPRGGDVTTTEVDNVAINLLSGIGECGSLPTFTNINEASTVASVFALAQYINPVTSPNVTIGTSSSAQGLTGLQNAFAIIPNLVPYLTGVANTTFVPTSSVAGVTVTGTPEAGKIGFIADILASCVDEYTNACSTLFAAATPPSAAITSQPSATFNAATDTLQAAYYMATNPTNSGTQITAANCAFNTSATSNLNCLYSAPTAAGSPFATTGFTLQPSDWTVSVTYTSSGTCTNANSASFFSSMESVAIDAGGNVWFNNGAATADALGELSSTGAPTVCAFGTIAAGRGLTIDTTGNVWTTSSTAASTTAVYEYLAGGTTLNWATATGANGIVSDGSGNIFYAPSGSATPFQEYVGASAVTSIAAGVPVGGNVVSSTGLLYVPVDPSGRIWAPTTSGAGVYEVYPGGTSPTNGYSQTDVGTVSLTTSVVNNGYGGAIDSSGNIYGGSTCCAATQSNTFFKITPGGTAGTATGVISPKYVGGLVAPRSTAIDGAGNIWAGMGYPVYTAALSPTGVAIFALAEVDKSFNSISSAGVVPATCSSTGTNCATEGGFQKTSLGTVRSLAVDPSGNVWAASTGTVQALVELVGTAVPVVTPLSIGAKNSTLGTKP